MDGKAEGRWLGTSPCDNESKSALRTNALRAYEGKSSEQTPPSPRSLLSTWGCNSRKWSRLKPTRLGNNNHQTNDYPPHSDSFSCLQGNVICVIDAGRYRCVRAWRDVRVRLLLTLLLLCYNIARMSTDFIIAFAWGLAVVSR